MSTVEASSDKEGENTENKENTTENEIKKLNENIAELSVSYSRFMYAVAVCGFLVAYSSSYHEKVIIAL